MDRTKTMFDITFLGSALDVTNRTRVYLRCVLEYEPGSQMETVETRAGRGTTLGTGKLMGDFV